MESFTLREATKGDSEFIAELVYKTEDDPEHVWGYGSREEIIDRIKWLVESEGSRYSYNNVEVAELYGKVCGAIILLKGNELSKLDLITSLKLFKHIKGMKNKIRFLKDVILELNFYECEENELYIANLATLEDFRGKGIGKALIKLAEKSAKKQGYKVCSLLAKDSGVKSFYEKLDFVFEKEESYYSHTLYRMIKTI
ncbi:MULTISPECIES: GNAT family N-acetyltransferase [unclassified Clostridium]|uniref:GNAT family N-acetyltransferase n=1 Tax=Clostridium TaxID=1485 RepID=UPI001C8C62F0|nr:MULTISPECIES: GNAT family N-acetyltransferase [unclassified Clostridium]MBX9138802.1 GNAT family N-acetyltransferase [Clostridium sp. K12(2020)]MBX9145565.1 GNAT family N-acetyltransferase [Clostridium sp. K13]MDU2291012.1 GNAT family N-acetyltransferase [Clostridium celatum]MDU4326181.1 GNAT family N-acetyltransferase [Clostridium celatum]